MEASQLICLVITGPSQIRHSIGWKKGRPVPSFRGVRPAALKPRFFAHMLTLPSAEDKRCQAENWRRVVRGPSA